MFASSSLAFSRLGPAAVSLLLVEIERKVRPAVVTVTVTGGGFPFSFMNVCSATATEVGGVGGGVNQAISRPTSGSSVGCIPRSAASCMQCAST